MVLATEMTKHFEHVNKFVNSINKPLAALEENGVRFKKKKKEKQKNKGGLLPDISSLCSVLHLSNLKSILLRQRQRKDSVILPFLLARPLCREGILQLGPIFLICVWNALSTRAFKSCLFLQKANDVNSF